jgi:hypothetical protein
MLNLLEKLQYGLSGLVVVGAIALRIWQGAELRSPEQLTPVRQIPRTAPPAAKSQPQAANRAALKPAASAEGQTIIDRLAKEQNVKLAPGKTVEFRDAPVDQKTFDFLKREANWAGEIQKAKSELLKGADGKETRLRLYDIEDSSLIKTFGFEEGDTVEFIDGERVDFSGSSSVDHIERWKKLCGKLQAGGKLSLTITRGGEPKQIEFKLQ